MHILLLVNSYVTDKDPRRGAKFRLQLKAYAKHGMSVGMVAIFQRNYSLADCLKNGGFLIRHEDFGKPVVRDCTRYALLRRVPFVGRADQSAWFSVRAIKRYIKEFGIPDLIHAHGSQWAGVTAFAAKKRWNIPYVITEHMNNYVMGNVSKQLMPLMRRVFANADMRLPISRTAGERIEKILGNSFKPWTTVPNMLDVDLFYRNQHRNESNETPVFLSVSHLHSKKSFDVLLKAFAKVVANRDAMLRIGGDGPERDRLHYLAAQLSIKNKVEFLGPLSRSEVAEEMANADVYVLSSQYETFGIPVVEAHASGLPVVSTRCGGPEDIVNESNGVLVETDDADALASGMELILSKLDSYDRDKIMNECRTGYSPDAVLNKLTHIYSDAIKAYSGHRDENL
jgi:glycosyltransferase involved in cell wall biosynthesis